jgi:hypothetical protein
MNSFMKHHHTFHNIPSRDKSYFCDGLITFVIILVILLTITFVNILKLTLSKHIGQNCLIWDASFCFGNSVMIPKMRLKGAICPHRSL